MNESWNNGLCREFVKEFGKIMEQNKLGEYEFSFDRVGYYAISLYLEMFKSKKSL